MKNYKEISDSVFEKSEKIISENKAKRRKHTIAVSAVISLCIVAAISIVFAKGGVIKKESVAAEGGRYDTICDSAGAQQNNGDYSQNTANAVSEAQSYSSRSQQAEVSQPAMQKTDAGSKSTTVQKTNSDSKITTTTKKFEDKKKIISDYEASSVACYAAPKNGEFFFSLPLSEAKKNYGSEVLYKLSINVFTDAEFLKDEKKLAAESERLKSLGFDAELKGKNGIWVIAAQMTAEEMDNFIPDSSLGYFFFLFDEHDAGLNIPLS